MKRSIFVIIIIAVAVVGGVTYSSDFVKNKLIGHDSEIIADTSRPSASLKKKLKLKITGKYHEVKIEKIIKDIAMKSDITMYISLEDYQKIAEIKIDIEFDETPVSVVMPMICLYADLEYILNSHGIVLALVDIVD